MPKLRFNMQTGEVIEAVDQRFDFVDGTLMVRLTDFVRDSYGSENVKRVGSTQLHKEASKLPGLRKVKGALMVPAMEAAELITEHGELSGSLSVLKTLIREEKKSAESLQKRVEREEKERKMRELLEEALVS